MEGSTSLDCRHPHLLVSLTSAIHCKRRPWSWWARSQQLRHLGHPVKHSTPSLKICWPVWRQKSEPRPNWAIRKDHACISHNGTRSCVSSQPIVRVCADLWSWLPSVPDVSHHGCAESWDHQIYWVHATTIVTSLHFGIMTDGEEAGNSWSSLSDCRRVHLRYILLFWRTVVAANRTNFYNNLFKTHSANIFRRFPACEFHGYKITRLCYEHFDEGGGRYLDFLP